MNEKKDVYKLIKEHLDVFAAAPVPYEVLLNYIHNNSHTLLRIFCHDHSLYQFSTMELISWLRVEIANCKAIEICAGQGHIGSHLDIPCTDAMITDIPVVQQAYRNMYQPLPIYPKHIEKLEALAAVEKYKPHTVIASWATYLGDPDQKNSSPYGVDDHKLLSLVKKYILIGNEEIHGHTPLLKLPHKKYKFDWLVSKAKDQSKNVIYVWENKNELY